ncbi:MAG: hypothetical protein SFU56_16875 [Capsulimonadales bacterium]|nr:hypothetical protein [Capsulimonadales bacterium]
MGIFARVSGDWQQSVTLGAVLVASLFLLRHIVRSVRPNGEEGCAGCGGCGKPNEHRPGLRPAPQAKPLVTLSPAPRRRPSPPTGS